MLCDRCWVVGFESHVAFFKVSEKLVDLTTGSGPGLAVRNGVGRGRLFYAIVGEMSVRSLVWIWEGLAASLPVHSGNPTCLHPFCFFDLQNIDITINILHFFRRGNPPAHPLGAAMELIVRRYHRPV
jgi:hypothetical protein